MKHSTIDDELQEELALYALGSLSQTEASALEAHLADGCELCESELKRFDYVVEALGVTNPSVNPPAAVREKLIRRLAHDNPPTPVMGDALQEFYSLRSDEGEWIETASGVFEKVLFVDDTKKTTTTLIKMLPNTQCPSHRHLGIEECLVLEGDFRVNHQVFKAGDFRCAMAGSIDEFPSTVAGNLLLIVSQGGYIPAPF